MDKELHYLYKKCPRCGCAMQSYESTNSSVSYYKCQECDLYIPIYDGQIGIGNPDELFKGGEK